MEFALEGQRGADPVCTRGALRVMAGPEQRVSVDYQLSQ